MALTNSQLLDRIAAGLGNRTDKTRAADYIPWMNLAQERIARKHPWEELNTNQTISVTPTGTPVTDKTYSTNTNIRDIQSIRFVEDANPTAERKLVKVPTRQWDKIIPAGEELATGAASHYMYYADTIEFYRVPDEAWTMQIRWTLWPSGAVDDSNPPDLENKDDLILYLALSIGFHELNMTQEGNRNFGIYSQLLPEAIQEDVSNSDTSIIERGISDGQVNTGPDPWLDPFQRGNL